MEFEPTAWRPPSDLGLTGVYAENERLTGAALWTTGGAGPEDVALDDERRPITGLADGRIIRFPPDGGEPETLGDTGGRPLGIESIPGGGLIVCDADRGLLHMEPDGAIEVLADHYRSNEFKVTNNASVAADGTIYFSVSSHRWPLTDYTRDILERSGTGRLYRRAPDGELTVLLEGLVFANGVALSRDEDFVLVAETGSYRIHRVWLTGEKAGTTDMFVENLPGFPDNLSRSHDIFWCAIVRLRDTALDMTLPRPWARRVIAALPEPLQPKPGRHGMLVAFDHSGRVVTTLQDPTGRVAVTTAARADGYRIYVGSFTEPHIAVAQLPTSFDQ
jgi:sugar lactone lactonase YvrE